jgi:cyanate lyase
VLRVKSEQTGVARLSLTNVLRLLKLVKSLSLINIKDFKGLRQVIMTLIILGYSRATYTFTKGCYNVN